MLCCHGRKHPPLAISRKQETVTHVLIPNISLLPRRSHLSSYAEQPREPHLPIWSFEMQSSPPISGDATLFCSDPHAYIGQGPADEVTELALEAQNIQTLNPAVEAVLQDPYKKKDFLHHMYRQVQLIKSRSQAFEDAHVTVYDKTLLTLTHNGNKLDHPPAIEYYCDEFLGVSNMADQVDATRMLEQSVCVPKLLAQSKQTATSLSTSHIDSQQEYPPPSSDPRSSIESFEAPGHNQRRQSTTTLATSDNSLNYARKTPEMEPQVARLWSLYEQARAHFQAVVPVKDSQATAESARFLRDTAENTIQYLKTKDFDPVLMAELRAVYDLAKAAAVSATGGKKRKFDIVAVGIAQEQPRGSYRGSSMPQRQERYNPYRSSRYPGPSRNDRFHNNARISEDRAPRVGRGPSGIPYGCEAQVPLDSVHNH